ncbi:hypothetical protein Rumeso_01950 [Rubellimicrobium mesophilum DSM 19309]|uniref:Uncharacterized protein n=1 Tax=Rubellimicrobium mesophilum DSM 19309 TaxID=442562 RepID=A0A017HS24_9RHOB|nr:hypothetical protein Rumeso_01950 [Rubellimicrobium mesophilum DSM 19309]
MCGPAAAFRSPPPPLGSGQPMDERGPGTPRRRYAPGIPAGWPVRDSPACPMASGPLRRPAEMQERGKPDLGVRACRARVHPGACDQAEPLRRTTTRMLHPTMTCGCRRTDLPVHGRPGEPGKTPWGRGQVGRTF